ncbi:MAG TPA: NAD-dependent epimerase [Prolixibacteraceae bacterium]|nr:NAD-dependent epimerase [Prolixibacteraceae bacterium]
MKILITGAAGFIGYHLVGKLAACGEEIIGIDNINDYYDVSLKYDRLAATGIGAQSATWQLPVKSEIFGNYSFIRMNLEDAAQLKALFKKEQFDVVCHLAAQAGVRYSIDHPEKYISSNIIGFFNVLEACRQFNIKHLVYASSSSIYGNREKMPLTVGDNTDHPVSLYAATKKSNELMAYTYSHLYDFKTTGLRFFTVYGPWGRPDMAPVLFADAISNGTPIKVFNHGNLERDFTYIDDIIEGIIRVIEHSGVKKSSDEDEDRGAFLYNIGNGSPVKLMDFISTMEKALGKTALKEFLPMQPGDVLKTFADISGLKNDFGYAPNTALEQGIREFVSWYQSYYNKA